MSKRKYWYEFHISECCICGSDASWKERVYDRPKPEEGTKRYVWEPQWACDDHFL